MPWHLSALLLAYSFVCKSIHKVLKFTLQDLMLAKKGQYVLLKVKDVKEKKEKKKVGDDKGQYLSPKPKVYILIPEFLSVFVWKTE